MKRLFIASLLAVAAQPVIAADIGAAASIGQPGFYGQIDINDYPQPKLIYHRPLMIQRIPIDRQPVYLNVPPEHVKNWRKHCHEYKACGERVYFVRNDWYDQEYVPRYQEKYRERRDDRRNKSSADSGGNPGGKEHGGGSDRGR